MEGNELPNNWVLTDLGTLSNLVRGVSYKKADAGQIKTEIYDTLILRGGNIQDGALVDGKDEIYVNSQLVKNTQLVKKSDVVIVGSTGSKKLIGKAGISLQDYTDTAFGAFLMLARAHKKINPNYFANFFLSKFYRDRIRELAGGVNINNIRKEYITEMKFPLPPRPEQDRIVAKVDTLMAQVETMQKSLERIPQLLKDFRQQVLTQAVTGKLTEEWREEKSLGQWKKTSIGQLFEVKTGATPKRGNPIYYKNGTIPWLKSGQVKNEFIYAAEEYITETAIRETNTKLYPIDTLLVAMYGEGKTRGQVGWMKIVAASNQAIAALVNENMKLETKQYVYYYCLSQYNEIRAKAEGGNQPNLSLSKIKNWNIELPPVLEQIEIVQCVESLFSKAHAIEDKYRSLKNKIDILPQAILYKAFKGELVEQLSTDGNAKELLKEIKQLRN